MPSLASQCPLFGGVLCGAIGGELLVGPLGALGGPAFALVAVTLGTLLTWRDGPPRPAQA